MLWFRHVFETARQATLLLLRSRVTLLLACGMTAVACILGGVAHLAAAEGLSGTDFVGVPSYLLVFMFVLPVTLLYLGVTAIHRDLEDRTATYLFVRPVRRSALLLGKWLAAACVGWAVAAFALTVIYTAVELAAPVWRLGIGPRSDHLAVFIVMAAPAALAYAAVGVALGAFFRRPLVAAAVFFAGFEFMASLAPPEAGVRGLTVADPVRRWLRDWLAPGPHSELNEVLTAGLERFLEEPEGLGDPLTMLARFTLLVLVFGGWIYGRREYDSRPRD